MVATLADDSDGNLLKIGIASVKSLYEEFINFVKDGFSIEEALPYFTTNVARSVALQNKKGEIKEGFDADILLVSDELDIKFCRCKG
ncbi:amidohydrolase family protein [Campylobacter concisus]